ncbi:uncharacterized protein [Dermacentor albipictus]|uniref:uncharacterized protein isoform X3 n=1 Tax=Dermacentor albipictus TaxID=60249 RepID=UPI0038FC06BD
MRPWKVTIRCLRSRTGKATTTSQAHKCLGLGVFVGMFARVKTNCSQKFLFATGLSYGLNDLNIVLTSLVSHETASFLPTVFYYLMYQ